MSNQSAVKLIDNYIYFYHLDKFCVIPQYPVQITDSNSASFEQTNILGRSSPLYSYSHSGPRTVSFNLLLHRDMLADVAITKNNFGLEPGKQYEIVEELINTLQASVLPKYEDAPKMTNPPIVAVRFGDNVYIKGVITGGVGTTYSGPIIEYGDDDNKKALYSLVNVSLTISEYDPYDAEQIKTLGSYRGLDTTVQNKLNGGKVLL